MKRLFILAALFALITGTVAVTTLVGTPHALACESGSCN